jgi:hypothetical protein
MNQTGNGIIYGNGSTELENMIKVNGKMTCFKVESITSSRYQVVALFAREINLVDTTFKIHATKICLCVTIDIWLQHKYA